ncbi:MAG TPA: FAD-dependent monooxygenase [Streptosporangiaceae bacterium]|nr:FAD-dependent monooxygenase [Streptosporangiaceae bacterium]
MLVDPVLIVGGGPVGLTTALLLARWGVPSIVFEAEPVRDRTGSRAICFQRDVLDIFDRIGCAEAMIAEGVTWTTGRTYYREHELFTVTFPRPAPGGPPPWINISQASVEGYLAAAAAKQPLIDIRAGQPVIGGRQTDTGVEVDTPAGTVRGSHLVGADGGHSTVRRLLGIEFPGRSYDDLFLICDIRADLPFPNERRFFFDPAWNPGRQVLVHQQPDSVWRIDWQVPPDFDPGAERASGALDARIRKIVGDRPYEIVWQSVYRFQERVAERFGVGRAFLVGDAAHLYAPFGARGLNSGVQDAENLAWKLAFVRRGWAPRALLDSYHIERRGAAIENLRVTGTTMKFLVPQTEEQRAFRRDTLDRALTDPAARGLINSGKLAEPYWYLDSPLTTPPTAPLTGPGPATKEPAEHGAAGPPAPGVLCPDAPCLAAAGGGGRREGPAGEAAPGETGRENKVPTRLRRLFGRGFVILAGGASAPPPPAAGCPIEAYAVAEIDAGGAVRAALGAAADGVSLVRPDGHLAAVLPGMDGVPSALRRALGHGPTGGTGPGKIF